MRRKFWNGTNTKCATVSVIFFAQRFCHDPSTAVGMTARETRSPQRLKPGFWNCGNVRAEGVRYKRKGAQPRMAVPQKNDAPTSRRTCGSGFPDQTAGAIRE